MGGRGGGGRGQGGREEREGGRVVRRIQEILAFSFILDVLKTKYWRIFILAISGLYSSHGGGGEGGGGEGGREEREAGGWCGESKKF